MNHPLVNRATKIAQLEAEREQLSVADPRITVEIIMRIDGYSIDRDFRKLLQDRLTQDLPAATRLRLQQIDTEIGQLKKALQQELAA